MGVRHSYYPIPLAGHFQPWLRIIHGTEKVNEFVLDKIEGGTIVPIGPGRNVVDIQGEDAADPGSVVRRSTARKSHA